MGLPAANDLSLHFVQDVTEGFEEAEKSDTTAFSPISIFAFLRELGANLSSFLSLLLLRFKAGDEMTCKNLVNRDFEGLKYTVYFYQH